MNVRILIASLLVILPCAAQENPWTSPRWDKAVIVEKLKDELPSSELDINNFLWTHFFNKPGLDAFAPLTATAQWKEWLPLFEQGLITKAQKQSLDAESLQQCLVVVSNRTDKIAHLPVAAYTTKQGEAPVWIIVLKWDGDHTQAFAFDARKRCVIGFMKCN